MSKRLYTANDERTNPPADICIVCTGLAFSVATVFQCSPMAAFWDQSMPGSKCFKNEPWWISHATVQISTDFLLLALPFRRILELSMGRAEKLGIALVFGTGGLYVWTKTVSQHDTDNSVSRLHPYTGQQLSPVPRMIRIRPGGLFPRQCGRL
jgi:hypothetical protein